MEKERSCEHLACATVLFIFQLRLKNFLARESKDNEIKDSSKIKEYRLPVF